MRKRTMVMASFRTFDAMAEGAYSQSGHTEKHRFLAYQRHARNLCNRLQDDTHDWANLGNTELNWTLEGTLLEDTLLEGTLLEGTLLEARRPRRSPKTDQNPPKAAA